MRPSLVRSKRAPQCSSSSTRAGASCAWSCAMRQLLSILPPRMVSRKCTFQLSSGYTLPSAAAMPPSAMTVCALPRSDLQMSAVLAPLAEDSIAARSPAPPAPITMTSNSCVSYLPESAMSFTSCFHRETVYVALEDPDVVDDPHRQEPDVDVGARDSEEADPRVQHMALVQHGEDLPKLVL